MLPGFSTDLQMFKRQTEKLLMMMTRVLFKSSRRQLFQQIVERYMKRCVLLLLFSKNVHIEYFINMYTLHIIINITTTTSE